MTIQEEADNLGISKRTLQRRRSKDVSPQEAVTPDVSPPDVTPKKEVDVTPKNPPDKTDDFYCKENVDKWTQQQLDGIERGLCANCGYLSGNSAEDNGPCAICTKFIKRVTG